MAKFRNINGVEVPRVTSILNAVSKPGLYYFNAIEGARAGIEAFKAGLPWKAGSKQPSIVSAAISGPKKVTRAAADRGTNIHKIIDYVQQGGSLDDAEKMAKEVEMPFFLAYKAFLNTYEVIILDKFTDRVIHEDRVGFCGEIDRLATVTNLATGEVWPNCLVDYKTGKGVYYTHLLQLAAYGAGLKKNGVKVDHHMNLILKPTALFEARFYSGEEMEDAYKAFLGAHAIFTHQQKVKMS